MIFWEYIWEIAGGLTLIGAPPLAAWASPKGLVSLTSLLQQHAH